MDGDRTGRYTQRNTSIIEISPCRSVIRGNHIEGNLNEIKNCLPHFAWFSKVK